MDVRKNREGERGAALVMVLMISALLLVAIGGLLFEASMNTANVTDATAEQQAYNAAESGIQSAVNVLRGNTDTTPNNPSDDISYRKAVSLLTSNNDGDTTGKARLSRWLNYNYTPNGAATADRITLSSGYNPQTGTLNTSYDPRSGYAFNLEVVDPNNTGNILSHSTDAFFYDSRIINRDERWVRSAITFGGLTITFIPQSPVTLDVSSGVADSANYGTFRITGVGAIPENIRFKIVDNITAPYTHTREMYGYIRAGTVSATNLDQIKFDFDSPAYDSMGTKITLDNIFTETVNDKNHFIMKPDSTGTLRVTGDTTSAEPFRLVLTATGYGPRGAKKVLEATIQKNLFNGMTAPATMTLIGPRRKVLQNGQTIEAKFEPGTSARVEYSGKDVVSDVIIPPIGTSNDENLELVLGKLDPNGTGGGFKGTITGESANVDAEMPFWLQNTKNLNAQIQELKLSAGDNYFRAGQTVTNVGNNANARGLTVVDGDLELSPSMSGGGILVVTGKLTLKGAFNFNGLIIVTGREGVERNGGGNGILEGNIVIAPYDPSNVGLGFFPPQYYISGGGNSEVTYNSSSVANGMLAVSNYVLGVKEK